MSTNPLERIPKRSPQTSVTDLNEFAKTAGSAAETAAYPIMLGLAGEDTGDEWYEDLAYGAVPGGALVQRAKTGTKPGLLDLLPGELGAGARLAMAPIAAAFSRDLLKGGKARLGKSAKNVANALDEKRQIKEHGGKDIVRYHRTMKGNEQSILDKGLLVSDPNVNSNTGRNTSDVHKLPPIVWLANNPTDIPVLRHEFSRRPGNVTTFEVRMPYDWYTGKKRYYFKGGRGGKLIEVPPGSAPMLTDEGDYMIDVFGENIPPEYLKQYDTMSRNSIPRYSHIDKAEMSGTDSYGDFIYYDDFAQDYEGRVGDKSPRWVRNSKALQELNSEAPDNPWGFGDLKVNDNPFWHWLNTNVPAKFRLVDKSDEFTKTLEDAEKELSRYTQTVPTYDKSVKGASDPRLEENIFYRLNDDETDEFHQTGRIPKSGVNMFYDKAYDDQKDFAKRPKRTPFDVMFSNLPEEPEATKVYYKPDATVLDIINQKGGETLATTPTRYEIARISGMKSGEYKDLVELDRDLRKKSYREAFKKLMEPYEYINSSVNHQATSIPIP